MGTRSRLRCGEPDFEVRENILDTFEADRETDASWRDPRAQLLLRGQLRMCRAGRVNGEAAHVAEVGNVAVQLECVDEATTGIGTAGQFEGEDCGRTLGPVSYTHLTLPTIYSV